MRELRELVQDLRPPALDELGLVEALRLQTGSMRAAGGAPMRITVRTGTLPDLSAAVEVAAYRITLEALANAARHSGSDTATVELGVRDDALTLRVTDGGPRRGPWNPGVGITSMRERAHELGGTLDLSSGTVRATIPLTGQGAPR